MSYAKKAGVQRVVLTSSTVAVSSDMESGVGGPNDWADPEKVGTYAQSKILAERAAWNFIESQEGMTKWRWWSSIPVVLWAQPSLEH